MCSSFFLIVPLQPAGIRGVQMACIVVGSEVKGDQSLPEHTKVSLDANGGGSVLVRRRGPVHKLQIENVFATGAVPANLWL